MKKIVIAGSAKFVEEIENWKNYFESKGYDVIEYTRKIDQTDTNVYVERYKSFFKALDITDELFVVNEEKNGIKGYVGAEVFAELSFIVANNILKNENRKVYLLNEPGEELKAYFELNTFLKLGYIELWNKNEK